MRTLAAAFVIGFVAAGCGAAKPPVVPTQRFVSRPDLRPPRITVKSRSGAAAPGYVFIAPKGNVAQTGPLIVDDAGHVVWFDPVQANAVTDFRVQRFEGRPVLTWWQATSSATGASAAYHIVDARYRPIATVRPAHHLPADLHEFLITPQNTALMTIFHRIEVSGREVNEGVVQERDIRTGRVLFEWHSIDHVALSESYAAPPKKRSSLFDYFHINSIEPDGEHALLVSARNTHAVYEVDRRTGRVLWRLGGKRSDFSFAPGARFAWQHDARRLPDGTISLFDNEAAPQVGPQSRGIVLRLDLKRRRAKLVRSFLHHPSLVAVDQGNMQRLPDGHFLIGWGHEPWYTEYAADGSVRLDAKFGGSDNSYRAFRFRWTADPSDGPALVVRGDTAYVSWNGATRVARWRLLAGEARDDLGALRVVPKRTFETALAIPNGARYIAVEALDAHGALLRVSTTIAHR